MRKIKSNAYVVDLPPDFGISLSFNVEDLIAYYGPNFFSDNPLLDKPSHEPISETPLLPPLPQIQPTHTAKQIDEIIDDKIVPTRDGGYHNLLICWRGLPDSENFWSSNGWILIVWSTMRTEEACIRHGRFFSNHWGNDGDITPRLLFYTMLCNTDTSIMEPCRGRNVSDTRVVCIFKNLSHVHMSCPFQRCRVRAT